MTSTNSNSQLSSRFASCLLALSIASVLLLPNPASAAILNASLGGTFTMNMNRDALALMTSGTVEDPGHFLVHYYDTVASDYMVYTDSYFYEGNTSRTEIPAVNLVHDLMPVSSSNPAGQAENRHVFSTTPNFAVDSTAMTATGTLGMTGMELYRGRYSGSLIYGDYTFRYNLNNRVLAWEDSGQEGTPSGWYLQNNVSFPAVVYELYNIAIISSDANNWQLSGDLLLSPENAGLLHGAALTDVGDFCLGVGSYAGCGQVSAVPIPAAAWLFASAFGGLAGLSIRRQRRNHA